MSWEIREGDCLEVMASMADNSIDAIVTDPPYFKVKGEEWDRQWDKPEAFLGWLDQVAEQWQRILRPNGSLYCFASPQMAARVEVLLGERFNVLNQIVWSKPAGTHGKACKEVLRQYFPQTERIIFAEHQGADNMAKGEAGYVAKCDELRGLVFEPLRAYLCGEFERAGMLNQAGKVAANVACGFSPAPNGMAARHYFSPSQWQLPTREHYDALRTLLNRTGGDYLRREYEDLRREYEDLRREFDELRQQYEELRRPFAVSAQVDYTDVWNFAIVQHYPGKHPCEKPQELLRHILKASTRPGAIVLDSFAGSGATVLAARDLGRSAIGIERDASWAKYARERLERQPEPTLFE